MNQEVKSYWQRKISRPIKMLDFKPAVWKQDEVVTWNTTLTETL